MAMRDHLDDDYDPRDDDDDQALDDIHAARGPDRFCRRCGRERTVSEVINCRCASCSPPIRSKWGTGVGR